jgi:NitT/TauT family transport system ATP-binding protein
MIEVRDISKTFEVGGRAFNAVGNISLSIQAGKFATVVGPSGCGKSTLLMMIAGLVKPTSGEVRVDSETISEPNPRKIGLVFQDATLLPWKTALGNVLFPLELSGVASERRSARARALLEIVGLEKFADHFPHELSGGMQQRIGIARGLAHDPAILLMDEPFSALDEQNRTKLGRELLKIWERTQKTVLFITHSLSEALYLSDLVYVMSSAPGRVIETIEVKFPRPRPLEIIGSPEFGQLRNRIWNIIADGDA